MNINLHPLVILFGAELLILLVIGIVILFIKMRKYKKLYQDLKKKTEEGLPKKEYEDMDFKSQDFPIIKQTTEETSKKDSDLDIKSEDMPPPMPQEPQEIDTSQGGDIMPTRQELEEEDNISKLKKIIEFQKQKIVDLMCYKDILESAEKRLSNIHINYQDLSQKFSSISEVIEENKEFELTLEMFGENTNELKDFISILKRENETLLEKFNSWQEHLKSAWKESDEIDVSGMGGDIEKFLKEKNELIEKLKDFEQKLNQKTKQLQEAQSQYEDLEKEYMTLYRQQHGG
ncbi:MAG: hypothetical protein SNJ53_06485 [Thermodesulfovibrionales bacterium]